MDSSQCHLLLSRAKYFRHRKAECTRPEATEDVVYLAFVYFTEHFARVAVNAVDRSNGCQTVGP